MRWPLACSGLFMLYLGMAFALLLFFPPGTNFMERIGPPGNPRVAKFVLLFSIDRISFKRRHRFHLARRLGFCWTPLLDVSLLGSGFFTSPWVLLTTCTLTGRCVMFHGFVY